VHWPSTRTTSTPYLQRGFCHSLQREYDLAVADFTSVIQRKPDHLWAYTSRGSAYGKLGKNNLAMADFNKVIAIGPEKRGSIQQPGLDQEG
jgi:tetratricopeptide (TPR) repeat protein